MSTLNNLKFIQLQGSLIAKPTGTVVDQNLHDVYKDFSELLFIKKSLSIIKLTLTNQKFKLYATEIVDKIYLRRKSQKKKTKEDGEKMQKKSGKSLFDDLHNSMFGQGDDDEVVQHEKVNVE